MTGPLADHTAKCERGRLELSAGGIPSSQSDNVTVKHAVRRHGDSRAFVSRVAGAATTPRGTLSEPATPGGRLLSQLPPVEVQAHYALVQTLTPPSC